jgi:sulfite exporter TauE/SafE
MDALLLGLSSGAICLASCAPFLIPVLAVEGGSRRQRRFALLGIFLIGRLLAYAAVGALAGYLGALAAGFLDPTLDRALLRAGWAIGGIVLLLGGLSGVKGPAFCSRVAAGERPTLSAFVLGVAAGLNLCPPFVAAAGRAAALGMGGGALYFALFFLGTSIWTLPFGLVPRLKKRAAEAKAVARIAMLLLGAYFFLILGVLGWN